MRFREKLLILFVAIVLSVLGFVLISSSFAELHILAREAGIDRLERSHSEVDRDKPMKMLCLNIYDGGHCFLRASGANK